MNPHENRFYLQALGVAGLFIVLLLALWSASGGPASEAQVRNANSTRTAIALTEGVLLRRVPTNTVPPFIIPTFVPEIGNPGWTPTSPRPVASATNTPLFALPPLSTPIPNQTGIAQAPGIPRTGAQEPAEFIHWYFGRAGKERDYRNLWDNFLTASYKANVGSGIFEDYVGWWNSIELVNVNSVDVIENNGTDAWVRVNLTFRMRNGRVLSDEIYDYDLLYDAERGTWMFDYNT